MRLSEHDDFAAIVVATAEQHGMPAAIVEKDYYVTETLRCANGIMPDRLIFKGGTSLSKGWRLIERFSEDIDLFVDPQVMPILENPRRIDKALKSLRDAVAQHPALTCDAGRGQTVGGLGREDYFAYESRFAQPAQIAPYVLVEPGIQSGDFPTARVQISSLAADYLRAQGLTDLADDLGSFEMTLLHYKRTYVEKLFTLHSKVAQMLEGGQDIGRHARHYADVHALGRLDDVRAMLGSPEYRQIKLDYDEKSRKYFRNYTAPEGLGLSRSPALFPDVGLRAQLEAAYDEQCAALFWGPYPTFAEVLAQMEELRKLL